jgi:hypothetical protein
MRYTEYMYAYQDRMLEGPLGNYLRGNGVRETDLSIEAAGAIAQVVSERGQSTMAVRIEPLVTALTGHWSQLGEMGSEAERIVDQETSKVEVK